MKGRPPWRPQARAEASPTTVRSRIELGERSEDPKTVGGRGVDAGTLTGEPTQAYPAFREIVHGAVQVLQVAADRASKR
jgi:hypothetical protein